MIHYESEGELFCHEADRELYIEGTPGSGSSEAINDVDCPECPRYLANRYQALYQRTRSEMENFRNAMRTFIGFSESRASEGQPSVQGHHGPERD